MRHLKKGHKLGRTASHRKAMLANMAASLIKFEQIQTTDAKAKALRPFVEKLITLGKRGDLHARRLVLARLRDQDATRKLFSEIAPRMAERPGGYTRILKIAKRKGDNAPISLIELVDASVANVLAIRGVPADAISDYLYEGEVTDVAVASPAVEEAPAAEVAEEAAEETTEE